MIFRFNKAQLGRNLESRLDSLLTSFQKGTGTEIEVIAVDFPYEFSVKVGEDVSVIRWNADEADYFVLPSPEQETEPKPEPKPEPEPESSKETAGFAVKLDMGGNVIPNNEQSMIIPAELAQRTHDVIKDNLRMLPGQRKIYHETLCELWIEED